MNNQIRTRSPIKNTEEKEKKLRTLKRTSIRGPINAEREARNRSAGLISCQREKERKC